MTMTPSMMANFSRPLLNVSQGISANILIASAINISATDISPTPMALDINDLVIPDLLSKYTAPRNIPRPTAIPPRPLARLPMSMEPIFLTAFANIIKAIDISPIPIAVFIMLAVILGLLSMYIAPRNIPRPTAIPPRPLARLPMSTFPSFVTAAANISIAVAIRIMEVAARLRSFGSVLSIAFPIKNIAAANIPAIAAIPPMEINIFFVSVLDNRYTAAAMRPIATAILRSFVAGVSFPNFLSASPRVPKVLLNVSTVDLANFPNPRILSLPLLIALIIWAIARTMTVALKFARSFSKSTFSMNSTTASLAFPNPSETPEQKSEIASQVSLTMFLNFSRAFPLVINSAPLPIPLARSSPAFLAPDPNDPIASVAEPSHFCNFFTELVTSSKVLTFWVPIHVLNDLVI